MTIRDLQDRTQMWVATAFPDRPVDVKTRAARFLEEALEAAQAAGLHRDDAILVMAQVYANPPGELAQELGGSMTTLCALAAAAGLDLQNVSHSEITRMETPEIIDRVRRRQAAKVSPR